MKEISFRTKGYPLICIDIKANHCTSFTKRSVCVVRKVKTSHPVMRQGSPLLCYRILDTWQQFHFLDSTVMSSEIVLFLYRVYHETWLFDLGIYLWHSVVNLYLKKNNKCGLPFVLSILPEILRILFRFQFC